MVEPEHHERVGVGENAFIDRQLVAGLVDALEDGDRMASSFAGDLLETEGRAVKQLKRSRNALEGTALRSIPESRRLARRRGERPSWSKTDCPSRQDRAATPTDSSSPVDAHAPLARRVFARNVVLIVGPGVEACDDIGSSPSS